MVPAYTTHDECNALRESCGKNRSGGYRWVVGTLLFLLVPYIIWAANQISAERDRNNRQDVEIQSLKTMMATYQQDITEIKADVKTLLRGQANDNR